MLAKRTAGAPLSEAELEQRRAAAKARWAAVGAGAATAATAGLLAHVEIDGTRAAAVRDVRAARTVIGQAQQLNGRRAQRHAWKAHIQRENLKPNEGRAWIDHAIRTSSSERRRSENTARTLFDEHAVDLVHGDGTPVRAVPSELIAADEITTSRSRAATLTERISDLRTKGKGAKRVNVDAGKVHAVAAYQRKSKGKQIGKWEEGADQMFAHLRERLGLSPAAAPATEIPHAGDGPRIGLSRKALASRLEAHRDVVNYITAPEHDPFTPYSTAEDVRAFLRTNDSLDRIARRLKDLPARDRASFLEATGLPKMVYTRPVRTIDVAAVEARSTTGHRMKVEGYPDRPTRKRLSAELLRDATSRQVAWETAEHARGAARITAARQLARDSALPSIKRLALLRHARSRFGLIAGAAASAGLTAGLGAWFATKRPVEKLSKVFDPTRHSRNAAGRFAGASRTQHPREGEPPRITVLVGMPGSGKSTWRALAMAQGITRPTTVVSSDDHVEAIARQKGIGFSEAFKLLDHKAVGRAHQAQIKAAVAAGHDIIVDKINASSKGRAKTLAQVPAGYEKHAVHFIVPEHVLRTRRALRPGKVIPQHALREMADAYQPPAVGEFDYVHRAVQHHNVVSPSGQNSECPPIMRVPLKLAKAAKPEGSPESTLAQRLAALFGEWTDAAEAKILAPSATTLHGDMVDGLDRAMAPLDQVVRDGITAPIAVDAGDGGQNLAFSLQARSPEVVTYIDQYRQSRIAELANEQKETIKGQLIDAAKAGSSPQEMALRIRNTIGLTSFQATHVVNYQRELEELRPAALERQLRDRRFDGKVQRAIDGGTPLEPDYIQKLVDAYHRRYLAFRATTIARTEAVGAASNGQAAAAAGLEGQHPDFEIEKEWIATDDDRTRHDHTALNGKVVRGLDTPFVCESGDRIRWPHDPKAPARQIIRCRCSFVVRLVPRLACA